MEDGIGLKPLVIVYICLNCYNVIRLIPVLQQENKKNKKVKNVAIFQQIFQHFNVNN